MVSSSRKSARRLVYRTLLLHGRNHEEAFAIIGVYFNSVYDRYSEYRQNPTELTRLILKRHKNETESSIDLTASVRRQVSRIIHAVYAAVKDQIIGEGAYSVDVPSKSGSAKVSIKPVKYDYALAVYEVEHPKFGIWHGCVSTATGRPMLPHHIDEFFDIFKEAERTSSRYIAKREKGEQSLVVSTS